MKTLDSLVAELQTGKRPKGGATESGIPSLGAEHLDNSGGFKLSSLKYVDEDFFSKMKTGIIQQNDIIIVKDGATTGKVSFVDSSFPLKKACINEHVFILRTNAQCHSKYVFYNLFSPIGKRQILEDFRGATVGGISKGFVNNVKFPLPTLPQQKKIAAILDAADAYRQKTKALIAKYDELTQSLFLDMFGDPVTNPKAWELVKFSDVGKLDRGKSKHRPRNAPELLGGDHPLIQTGDLANCGIYLTKFISTYSDIGLAQSKKWPAGTLCITIAANIAKTGILTFDACFPDSVVGFIPNEKTNNIYTLFWMSFLQKILEETAPESAQKNINLAILRALDFPLPDIELQNQFAERVQAIEQQKAKAQASLVKAEDLFNSLLQRAFKGELN